MENVEVLLFTVTIVAGASGAPLPEHHEVKMSKPRADFNVTCGLKEDCVLPCPFDGEIRRVSWKRWDEPFKPIVIEPPLDTEHPMNRDYLNIVRISRQEPEGGAALVIGRVELKHEGLHQCTVESSTRTTDRFVELGVYTPGLSVSLRPSGPDLVCRSEEVYPRPTVDWTFRPGPGPENQTSINPSQSGLFSVLSSVPLTQRPPLEYSCNISTEHSWRSATYRRNPPISLSESVTVPCAELSAPVKSLVWRFNRETVYSRTGSDQTFGEFWTQFVDGITESNGLRLKDLTEDQLGLFSCELLTDSETHVAETELTRDWWAVLGPVLGGVLGLIIIIIIVIGIALCIRHQRQKKREDDRRRSENDPQIRENLMDHHVADPRNERRDLELRELREIAVSNVEADDMESWYESQFTDSRPESRRSGNTSGYGCGESMDGVSLTG